MSRSSAKGRSPAKTRTPKKESGKKPAQKSSAKKSPEREEGSARPPATFAQMLRGAIAVFLAWIVPGVGHVYLKRPWRGAIFGALVLFALVFGCFLHGRLYWVWSGSPLRILATLGCLGAGAPFLALRFLFGYEGDIRDPGFEYGTTFLLSSGLMNLLVVLDAWDIALERKE